MAYYFVSLTNQIHKFVLFIVDIIKKKKKKLWTATIRFTPVRLSVRMEQLGFYWVDFHEIL
jgi:hypothetical protein